MTVADSASFAPQLLDAYREADKAFRVQQARLGCLLVLICMPLGLSLDWFVYPELLVTFLVFGRLLCDVAVLPLYLVLLGQSGEKHVHWVSLLWPILPAIAISWMIFMSDGARSPYYAGLILVLIVACQLMPYSLREAATVCLTTMLTYLVACLAHAATTTLPISASGLFNGFYFISITALICLCSSHYNTRRRIKEFALRRELDQRNQELAQLDRLKSEFFANISHELRTPLTLILAPIDHLMQRSDLSAAAHEWLQVVRQNGLRLLKLITDLLEVVRLDERATVLQREPVELSRFVKGLVDSVRHTADQKHLRLQVHSAEPVTVTADLHRLEKILLNLLTNALKFTPTGGAVTVTVSRNGSTAKVSVRDTGIGIPAKDLPHIFDRFRQVDGSATRRFQGVGIGLALARELALEHGGTLEAASKEGHGAEFTLALPIASPPSISPESVQAASDPIAKIYAEADRTVLAPHAPLDWDDLHAVQGDGPQEILVVEDEPDLRRFIVSLMVRMCRVRQAGDGHRGLEAVRAHRPHLVLLDLMLPDLDGQEVCRRIKSDPDLRSTRIILLTARTDESSKLAGLRAGADDFLQKPFSAAELQSRVSNLLRAAELEQSLRDRNHDLAEAMDRLKATEVQLVQSEKMNAVGRLSAGILHEINNPLNASIMAVHVAQMKSPSPAVSECLVDLDASLKRIQTITTSLRTFAHPGATTEGETFTVESLVAAAEQLLAHDLAGQPIERHHVNGTLVRGCRNQITHVMINLVGNALHAVKPVSNSRSPRIMVDTVVDAGRLHVTVEDNGVGIAAEDLGHVTEPFFTRREVGQGMGLGLSICQTIVASHGGTLRVQSLQGAWTRVTFDLPCAELEQR